MNAMLLFKALNGLDPQDIADAWDGGQPEQTADEVFYREPPVLPAQRTRPRLLRRAAEIAAAAACVALGVTAVLKFRALVTTPPQHSVPDTTAPVTAETTQTETTGQTEYTDTTASLAATGTEYTGTELTGTDQTAETTAADTAQSESSLRVTETTETDAGTEPAPPQTPARVPVLAAMGDGAGQLYSADDTPCAAGGFVWSKVQGKDAVEAYLAGDSPEVILGTGRKSGTVTDAIRSDPAMIRVRWQAEDSRWESYGITSAEVRDGVLHLGLAVYCADPEGDFTRSPWIYEAGLVVNAAELPGLRDVQIMLTEYSDTDETGISEWMRYNAALDPDIYLTVTN